MSVDLVNAQMAEAWQVQRKRWEPQLRQEEMRDGQSSEVLKNQNMLHIVSLDNPRTSASWSPHLFRCDGGFLDLPSDCDWSESSVEVITLVKNQGQCGSCWAFCVTDALEESSQWVMHVLTRCPSSRSLIATHGVRGAKVDLRHSSACSEVAT